mmetsp:Transcript_54887/g.163388  ORF Transcript_54887/g.163388 Transcript_54887/m.163388 type:complete len:124 (-) Transcript_54887:660-1031(-)
MGSLVAPQNVHLVKSTHSTPNTSWAMHNGWQPKLLASSTRSTSSRGRLPCRLPADDPRVLAPLAAFAVLELLPPLVKPPQELTLSCWHSSTVLQQQLLLPPVQPLGEPQLSSSRSCEVCTLQA